MQSTAFLYEINHADASMLYVLISAMKLFLSTLRIAYIGKGRGSRARGQRENERRSDEIFFVVICIESGC